MAVAGFLVVAGLAARGLAAPPTSPVAVELELVADGLTAPIDLKQPDDGTGRRFVLDQSGLVRMIAPDGRLLEEPLLDLRTRMIELEEGFEERGLLGLALHPDFATSGRFYVTYSAPLREDAPSGWNYTRRVSEFTVDVDDPNRADPASERVLLELDWPSRKHNGGGLAFGPDGHLYIGLGDGGGAHGVGKEVLYDAFSVSEHLLHWDRLAQDTNSLFGSILRIDVDRGFPGYGVPELNPFVGKPGRDEIYAWGFRNPYRIAFDRGGRGDMVVTAIAETLWEAVYMVDRPGNYGWPIREGTHCVDRLNPGDPPPDCPGAGAHGERIVDPIVEYPNMKVGMPGVSVEAEGLGTAVVGGQIYRGEAIPELAGRLVFGDWSADFRTPSGQLFVATPPDAWGALWTIEKLLDLETRIVSVAQDAAGELHVLTNDELGPFGTTGKVFRLIPGDS